MAWPALASPAAAEAAAGLAGVVPAASAVPIAAAVTAKTTSATVVARRGSRSDILGNSLLYGHGTGEESGPGAANRMTVGSAGRVVTRSRGIRVAERFARGDARGTGERPRAS